MNCNILLYLQLSQSRTISQLTAIPATPKVLDELKPDPTKTPRTLFIGNITVCTVHIIFNFKTFLKNFVFLIMFICSLQTKPTKQQILQVSA